MQIYILPFSGGASTPLLTEVLSSCTDLSSAKLTVRPDGKPELRLPDGSVPLRFNLSHSGGLMAVAAADTEVGVDIEPLTRKLAPSFAKRMLSPEELLSFPPLADTSEEFSAEDHRRLLTLWTLKEALTKQTGAGIRTDFRTITLRQMPDGTYVAEGFPGIRLRTFTPAPGFVGALAWEE